MWRATLAAARETWCLMGLPEQVSTYVKITIDTEMTSAIGICIMSKMVISPECRHLSSGNLRRLLPFVASNAVRQHHRSGQALLTIGSPSAQVT
jgi:hypothetical protein